MSGYNYNQYTSGGIPDQGANGLPLDIASANLPTQNVSIPKVMNGQGTSLHYSPYSVESQFMAPSNTAKTLTNPVAPQKFQPTAQPAKPALWKTVVQAVMGNKIKTGSSYAATGDYTANGVAGGAGTQGGGVGRTVSTGGTGAVTRSNSA